jgi:hypothetical protein
MGYIGAGITRFNTADELTVTGDAQIDTTTLVVDSTNNRVGIGTSSPASIAHALHATSPKLTLERDSTSLADNNVIGEIAMAHKDSNDAGTAVRIIGRAEGTAGAAGLAFNTGTPTSISEAMRIDSSGNVGIGIANPARALHISSGHLRLSDNYNVEWGGGTNYVRGSNASNYLLFATNGSEAARIDSSGNVLVGGTDTNPAGNNVAGVALGAIGTLDASYNGASLDLNRITTDGNIANFRKDGTTVGSIGVKNSDNLYIATDDTNDCGLKFDGDNQRIEPCNADGTSRDDALDLGAAAARFNDIYLSGGAYLGGTAAANLLDDYEEGSGTLTLEDATSGGNVSSTTGTFDYVKIGKVVHLRYNFENISTSGLTSGNSLYAHGLPFTASQNHRGIVFSQFLNVDSGTYDLEFRVNNATTYGFWNMSKDAASGAVVTPSDMTSGSTDMRGSITYFTSS